MKTDMEINDMNYEMFALDYAEGRLSGPELDAMEAFLAKYPELRAEILEISRTLVPEDPDSYGNLDSLKRFDKRGRGVVYWPGLTAQIAAAAVLVLALGLFWMFGRGPVYGELAAGQPAFTIHYSIDLTYRGDGVDKAAGLKPASGERTMDEYEMQFAGNTPSVVHTATDQEYRQVPDSKVHETAQNIASSINDPGNGEAVDATVPFRVKMTIVNPAEVPVDDYYVLPVTIEMHRLSMEASTNARAELEDLASLEATKSARKRWIREGTLSLLQDTFMPEGINDLLNN